MAWHYCLAVVLAGLVIMLWLQSPVRSSSGQGTPPATESEAVLAYNPHNLLRLHILANSDDPADQQLKLRVRDRLLELTSELFHPVHTAAEAEWVVRLHANELAAVTVREIRTAGKQYGVRIEIGDVYFPDRRYGALIYPAGVYRAVQVVLGEGKGANWWCVLFPPLCLDPPTSTADAKAGSGIARAALAEGRSDRKPVQVRVGWKWLPDDWWDRVRGWFR